MLFFLVAVLAGLLTVVAPCILPLIPIVIGTAGAGTGGLTRRSVVVIGALSLSVVVFTLLLKLSTIFIAVPPSFWQYLSGAIIIFVGVMIAFPAVWARLPYVATVSTKSNQLVGSGYQRQSVWGDVLVGVALGPVFTTCSPTYLYIIATVLPASLLTGLWYLSGFVLGLAGALLGIAYFGERLMQSLSQRLRAAETIKRWFGAVLIVVGLLIATGLDKQLETAILDAGYGATIQFEQRLLDYLQPSSSATPAATQAVGAVPPRTLDSIATHMEPKHTDQTHPATETITLAGGCFWCVEAALQPLPGVLSAVSGYVGGSATDATYRQVSSGRTSHREAVQVVFDPAVTSLTTVLNTFWQTIDPTDAGGQFADRGPQYTTAIYYADEAQQRTIEQSKNALASSGLVAGEIATAVLPAGQFYPAEEYHQDYFLKAADHYQRYKTGSGRAGFVEATWARDAARAHFASPPASPDETAQ